MKNVTDAGLHHDPAERVLILDKGKKVSLVKEICCDGMGSCKRFATGPDGGIR